MDVYNEDDISVRFDIHQLKECLQTNNESCVQKVLTQYPQQEYFIFQQTKGKPYFNKIPQFSKNKGNLSIKEIQRKLQYKQSQNQEVSQKYFYKQQQDKQKFNNHHQNIKTRIISTLQNLEHKLDGIHLQKEQFFNDLKTIEESEIIKIEQQQILEYEQRKPYVRQQLTQNLEKVIESEQGNQKIKQFNSNEEQSNQFRFLSQAQDQSIKVQENNSISLELDESISLQIAKLEQKSYSFVQEDQIKGMLLYKLFILINFLGKETQKLIQEIKENLLKSESQNYKNSSFIIEEDKKVNEIIQNQSIMINKFKIQIQQLQDQLKQVEQQKNILQVKDNAKSSPEFQKDKNLMPKFLQQTSGNQNSQNLLEIKDKLQTQIRKLEQCGENLQEENDCLTNFISNRLSELTIDFNQDFLLKMSINQKKLLAQIIGKHDPTIQGQCNKVLSRDQSEQSENNNLPDLCDAQPDRNLEKIKFISNLNNSIKSQVSYQVKSQEISLHHIFNEQKNRQKQMIQFLQVEYSFYFQNKYPIFLAQAQNEYLKFVKQKQVHDFTQNFQKVKCFDKLTKDLQMQPQFSNKLTICLDFISVFLRQIDQTELEELQEEAEDPEFKTKVLIIQTFHQEETKSDYQINPKCADLNCTQIKFNNKCFCKMKAFIIRPFSFQLLLAIQPFYEIIAISNIPYGELIQIVDHFEEILNQEVQEKNKVTINRFNEMSDQKNFQAKKVSDSFARLKIKTLQLKQYFQFIICRKSFFSVPKLNYNIENLKILLLNRKQENIFLVSSSTTSLVAAMDQGFCGIPVTQFFKIDSFDYQLVLLQRYLINLQFTKNPKTENTKDFGSLLQSQNIIMKEQLNQLNFKKQINQNLQSVPVYQNHKTFQSKNLKYSFQHIQKLQNKSSISKQDEQVSPPINQNQQQKIDYIQDLEIQEIPKKIECKDKNKVINEYQYISDSDRSIQQDNLQRDCGDMQSFFYFIRKFYIGLFFYHLFFLRIIQ